jgi:hypothetical protein
MQVLDEIGDDFFGRTFYGKRNYKVKRISYHQWRSDFRGRNCSLTIEKVLWGDYLRILLNTGDCETRAVSLDFKGVHDLKAFEFDLASKLMDVFSKWRN